MKRCAVCAKSFSVWPSHLDRRVTCSRECSSALKAARSARALAARGLDAAALRKRYLGGSSIRQIAQEDGHHWARVWRVLGKPARNERGVPEPPPTAITIWAAGFFDGEGTVHLTKRGELIVMANQIVERPLMALQRAFGGNIRPVPARVPGYRDQWSWVATGPRARNFLTTIRPYLLVRGTVADAALEEHALNRWERGRKLEPAEVERRLQAHARLAAINRRGRTAA